MYKKALPLLIAAASLLSTTAQAQDLDFGVKAGTLGLGLELDYSLSNHWNVRVQTNSFSYDDDFEEDGIKYSGELDLGSTGILLDWRPWGESFRITGGFYRNNNKLTGQAREASVQVYDIGDASYTSVPGDPLVLDANVELGKSSAGYLGMGWGNAPSPDSKFSFTFEMGVLFAGKPKVKLQASGSANVTVNGVVTQFNVAEAGNPLVDEFNANMRLEEANLEDDISDFKVYPVIAIGISYQF